MNFVYKNIQKHFRNVFENVIKLFEMGPMDNFYACTSDRKCLLNVKGQIAR